METINYSLVIPAAGSGSRIGSQIPKQFIKIKNKEIILYTIDVFMNSGNPPKSIIISTSENHLDFLVEITDTYDNVKVVLGGATRQESVYKAINVIENSDYVLIHDSVRPFVSNDIIHKVLKELSLFDGVIPGVPVKDTIKRVQEGKIIDTPKRSELFAAQTPQGFKLADLIEANNKIGDKISFTTDDASIFELAGKDVVVVEGDYDNFKITTKDDLEIAKRLL